MWMRDCRDNAVILLRDYYEIDMNCYDIVVLLLCYCYEIAMRLLCDYYEIAVAMRFYEMAMKLVETL